jgi:hypothetical protein
VHENSVKEPSSRCDDITNTGREASKKTCGGVEKIRVHAVHALSDCVRHAVLARTRARVLRAWQGKTDVSSTDPRPFPHADDDIDGAWTDGPHPDAQAIGAEADEPRTDTSAATQTLSYWEISRTPLTSLVFTMPLVLAYEGGVLLLGRGTPRNGADVWLRQALDGLGFGTYFLLPTLTVLGLLAWHHVEHDRWRFSPAVLVGMAGESVLWAALLVGVARLQERLWPLQVAGAWDGVAARLVGYCGAGLYEEVLFRLLLLPVVAWGLRRMGGTPSNAMVAAILLTSAVFSLAHYVGPLGDAFELYSFTFRTIAGIFFALVFLGRGFGIAAGTHAIYDMLVGLR